MALDLLSKYKKDNSEVDTKEQKKTAETPATPKKGLDLLSKYKKTATPETAPVATPAPTAPIAPVVQNDDPSKVAFPTAKAKEKTKGYFEDWINERTDVIRRTTDYSKVSSANRYGQQVAGAFTQGILSLPKAVDDLVDLFKGQALDNGNWTDKLAGLGNAMNENYIAMVTNKQEFSDKLASGVGSMGSFLIPSGAVGQVSKVVTMFKTSPAVANAVGTIFAQTSMVGIEASMEASSVYDEVLKETGDEDKAIKMAENTAVSNALLIGVTNKFSKYFEPLEGGAKNAVKRVITAYLSEGGQEGGQAIIQNIATGKNWSEGVAENALIGGIIGAGATLATTNVFKEDGTLDKEKLQDVINTTYTAKKHIEDAKEEGITEEEIVNTIAENNDITVQEAENIVKTAKKTVEIPTNENDLIEREDNLLVDIKTAIEEGSRVSAISSALQDQYGVSAGYADNLVAKALADVQTPKIEVPLENNPELQKPTKTKVEKPTKTENKETKKSTQKTVEENTVEVKSTTLKAHLLNKNTNKYEPTDVTVTGEGDIVGNKVFTFTETNGQTSVTDRKTGRLIGYSRFKNSKRAIADVANTFITKAGSEEKLKSEFTKAQSDKAVLNDVINSIDNKKKKEYTKSDDKTIQRTTRNKRSKVSKSVSNGTDTSGEAGSTLDVPSETVLQDGQSDNGGATVSGDTNGNGLVKKARAKKVKKDLMAEVNTVTNPTAETEIDNVMPEIQALDNVAEDLKAELEKAPEEVKAEIQDTIDTVEENKAELENDFLDKFQETAVTNEDIDEIVNKVTVIDETTKEITINPQIRVDELMSAMDMVKSYKSGGVAKEGRGILDEYYTDKKIVDTIYSFLDVKENAKVLEPSIGVGNFVPSTTTNVDGYEINPTTAGIAKMLNPLINVYNKSFETNFIDETGNKKEFKETYDLVIGNPPYGEHRGFYKGLGEEKDIAKYEDYFTKRGLDVTKQGGYVVFVLPSGFLMRESNKAKQGILASNGVLVDAFRLPNGAFAGTDIGTDIVILKKGTAQEARDNFKLLVENNFFIANPSKILGEATFKKNRFGQMDEYVEGDIDTAISMLNDLNVQRIAIGVAENVGIEPTQENIDSIKEVIAESATNDVQDIVKVSNDENKVAEEKQKKKDVEKTKKITEKIKKSAGISNAKQVNLGEIQDVEFTASELAHWNAREKDGSLPESFANDPNITSYYAGKWYMDFTYLQGNIYEKLDQLETDKSKISDEQYTRQKTALEAIKPAIMPLERVKLNANSTFLKDYKLPKEDYVEQKSLAEGFLKFVNDLPTKVLGGLTRSDIRGYVYGDSVTGGSKDVNARIRKDRPIVANEILSEYLKDLKANNPELGKDIEASYNKQYNATFVPDYLNVPITITVNNSLNGSPFKLTSVQQQAIGRLIEKGVGILAHDVGFGKTLTAILATYQNMQNGHTKKPLMIVPKATYNQWVNTIMEVVPNAKINSLYNLADGYKGDLSSLQINDGEFNLITEEGFKRLSFKGETYDKYARKYAYVTDDLTSDKSAREAEKAKEKAMENKGKMVKGSRGDLYFEELGFDHIVVDEVHNANNIITKIKMPKGKSTEFRSINAPANPSQYGVKTWLASQYIQENNNGKNVYLLSATPFTNSPLQYFSVLSLLANKTMKDMGIDNVNDFLNQFMDMETKNVYKPNGTVSEKQTVRNFKNYNLLQKLLGEYMDFKNGDDNPDLIRPDKHQKVNYFSQSQDYIDSASTIQRDFGGVKDTLKLIGQLRALSISSSLLSGSSPDISNYKEIVEKSPKLYAIAQNIINNQKLNKENNREATEIVYTPFGVEIFPILKQYLMKEGKLKAEEIAIITGETKADKRAEIQEEFNKTGGTLKILMGTDTIGTGMNLQKRTSDIHFLGLPYNFTDLIQVEGRGWRQGNKWRNVRMNHYLMENSYDALHFQILTSKQKRYELAIKNNEDNIDVGDVDTEQELSNLLTDPNLIAELKIKEATTAISDQIRLKNGELGFLQKKVEKLGNAQDNLLDLEKNLEQYTKYAQENDSEYMKKYYEDKVKSLTNDVEKQKTQIEQIKQKYADDGIAITDIVARIDPLVAEIKSLRERMSDMTKPENKIAMVNKIRDEIKPIVPFETSDVKPVLEAYTAEAKTFYTEETRHLVAPKIEEVKVEKVTEVAKPKSDKKTDKTTEVADKVQKTTKKPAKVAKKAVAVTPELAIINDSSLNVSEKVEALLNRKQEGKEYKDVGERVAGSKKEKASVKAIYKHGGQAMFDEIVNKLGWEAVLETVDKAEILEETNAKDTIQRDYDNKVPAELAKVKKDILDSIYRVPKLAGKKSGKYSWSHYVFERVDGYRRGTSDVSELIPVAKIYPTILKQLVNKILSVDMKNYDFPRSWIEVDANGNILEKDSENMKYEIDLRAFGFSDNVYKTPKTLIRETIIGDYNREKKVFVAPEFDGEKYKALLNPEAKDVNKSDDKHGNFDAIDKYDIGDEQIAKEKVKAETLTAEYGFKSVQLGNYMDDASSYEHIQQTMGAIDSMSKALNIDFKKLISKKGLSIAYGARGGGKALAHYEPDNNIINMTKKRGDGSFAHEFMHFIDYTASTSKGKRLSGLASGGRYYMADVEGRKLMQAILSGGYTVEKTVTPDDTPLDKLLPDTYYSKTLGTKEDPRLKIDRTKAVQFILEKYNSLKDSPVTGVLSGLANREIYINRLGEFTLNSYESEYTGYANNYTKITPQLLANIVGKELQLPVIEKQSIFKELSQKYLGNDVASSYWVKPQELLARAFEAYMYDKMAEAGSPNNYAVQNNIAQTDDGFLAYAYPQGAERVAFNKLFDKYFADLARLYPLEEPKFKMANKEVTQGYASLYRGSPRETNIVGMKLTDNYVGTAFSRSREEAVGYGEMIINKYIPEQSLLKATDLTPAELKSFKSAYRKLSNDDSELVDFEEIVAKIMDIAKSKDKKGADLDDVLGIENGEQEVRIFNMADTKSLSQLMSGQKEKTMFKTAIPKADSRIFISDKRFENYLDMAIKKTEFNEEQLNEVKELIADMPEYEGQVNMNVKDILVFAIDSIYNKKDAKTDLDGYVKLISDWQAEDFRPAKIRWTERGLTIEDGNHRLMASAILGIKNYPVIDVTDDYAQYKGKVQNVGGDTVSGQFLKEASERLKINFDWRFFDTIYGQAREQAWGVTHRNSIGLQVNAPFTTEHHEFVHLTLKNLNRIEALKGLSRDEILIEQAEKMGLPIEKYTSLEVEEALANDFENYVATGVYKPYKAESKIERVFAYLREQLTKILKAIKLTNGSLVQEYFDILLSGRSETEQYVDLSNGRDFDGFIRENSLDFSKTSNITETEFELNYKKKLDDVVTETNSLIEQLQGSKEVMQVVAKYAEQASIDEIVDNANTEVSEYVKAVLEIETIKNDITDASLKFKKLIAQRENVEDLRIALESKLNVIVVKVGNTSKRVKKATPISKETLANVTIAEVVDNGEVNEAFETTASDSNTKARSVSKRLSQLVGGMAFEGEYDVQNFVNQVAKSEKIIENNKGKIKDILNGKFPYPTEVSKTTFLFTLAETYKEKGDTKMLKKIYDAMAETGTQSGQDIAFLNSVYKTYDETSPETYLNRLQAERERLSLRDSWKLNNPFKMKERYKQVKKEKKDRKAKAVKSYEEIRKVKQQKLEDIINSFMC